jgi:hypothetical protein
LFNGDRGGVQRGCYGGYLGLARRTRPVIVIMPVFASGKAVAAVVGEIFAVHWFSECMPRAPRAAT